MEYIFRPIERWPVKPTPGYMRRERPFKATWQSTLKLVESELNHLSAKTVVIQAYVSESEIRNDGMLRAHVTPSRPGIILAFQSKHGPLSYPCDSCMFWQHNVRSIGLALQALRAVDRYGVTGRAEQYRGWQQLPSQSEGMSVAEAQAILEAFGGDGKKAKIATHPDHGGSPETFRKVTEACELLGV